MTINSGLKKENAPTRPKELHPQRRRGGVDVIHLHVLFADRHAGSLKANQLEIVRGLLLVRVLED
jgi:hypothetical protein